MQLCDSKGLSCLTNYFGEISKEKRYCDCLASCEEAEYSTLYSSANEYIFCALNHIKQQFDLTLDVPIEYFVMSRGALLKYP